MSSKMGDSLFKLGRYNGVFLEIWAQIPIWASMLKQWAVGSFLLMKILQKSSQGPTKVLFFIKTRKWEKWWSWWLRMLSYYVIYCEKRGLAVNREGSFKYKYVCVYAWDSRKWYFSYLIFAIFVSIICI